VGLAFRYNSTVVNENLSKMDLEYLKYFDNHFSHLKDKPLKLLDLGCGKGRFLDYFKEHYPNWEIIGVEPTFEKEKEILKGSAYSIPVEDKSIDIIFTIEVLQHTYIEQVLKEVRRVLKDDGYIAIGDRNPYSILGVLKPIFEIKDKWMYPWDSPFRERWYNQTQWKKILNDSSFKMKNIDVINNPNDRKVKFLNRYYFIIGEKNG
jgi:ubiquinone/menaquinone biosynthesis C-methylase UbiE